MLMPTRSYTYIHSPFRANKIFVGVRQVISYTKILSAVEDSIMPAVYVTDLYKALGVNKSATKDDLRDAYWSIAAKNHPDRNKVLEKFKTFDHFCFTMKSQNK